MTSEGVTASGGRAFPTKSHTWARRPRIVRTSRGSRGLVERHLHSRGVGGFRDEAYISASVVTQLTCNRKAGETSGVEPQER